MKYLKDSVRILVIAGVLFTSIPGTFAAEGCALEKWLSSELEAYSNDLNMTLSKLEQASADITCTDGATGDIEKASEAIEGAMNGVLGQSTYRASAAFVTDMQIKSETPKPVMTHLTTLYSQSKQIQSVIQSLHGKCASDKKVTPSEIFPGGSSDEKLTDSLGNYGKAILQNHTELIHLYRTTVLGYPQEGAFFALVSNKDFSNELKKNYGLKGQENCKKKDDVFKQLSEVINKISKTASSIKTGMNAWQTADLKTESAGEREMRADREKNLLPAMRKAGLNENNSDNTLRKSKKYNLLDSDRGFTGFVRDSWERLAQTFDNLKSSFTFVPPIETAKNTDEWLLRYKNLSIIKNNIAQEINAQFIYQMDLIGNEQVSKDDYEGKLGSIYISIEAARKKLEGYRKVARKICKLDQASNVDAAGCEPE
jgi:hypothetical protein